MRLSPRITALVLMTVMCSGTPAVAQLLRGRIADAVTGEAVARAQVSLRTIDSRVVSETAADSNGVFQLRVPRVGSYIISVTRIGYRAYTSIPFDLNRNEMTEVAITLSSSPITVDSLVVIARHALKASPLAGFQRRRAEGVGSFFAREDIERRFIATPTTLLLPVPGIILDRTGGSKLGGREAYTILFQGRGVAQCVANVYLDGVFVGQNPPLDDWLDLTTIAGVEVYARRIDVPIEYRRDDCGAVLFWTREPEATRHSSRARAYVLAAGAIAVVGGFLLVR